MLQKQWSIENLCNNSPSVIKPNLFLLKWWGKELPLQNQNAFNQLYQMMADILTKNPHFIPMHLIDVSSMKCIDTIIRIMVSTSHSIPIFENIPKNVSQDSLKEKISWKRKNFYFLLLMAMIVSTSLKKLSWTLQLTLQNFWTFPSKAIFCKLIFDKVCKTETFHSISW